MLKLLPFYKKKKPMSSFISLIVEIFFRARDLLVTASLGTDIVDFSLDSIRTQGTIYD
jgi:hypothetical protein